LVVDPHRLPDEAHSDGETDQKQTRSSTPGQTKKMTNVLRNVIAIAILTINGKGRRFLNRLLGRRIIHYFLFIGEVCVLRSKGDPGY
jgi:hypothetical protein